MTCLSRLYSVTTSRCGHHAKRRDGTASSAATNSSVLLRTKRSNADVMGGGEPQALESYGTTLPGRGHARISNENEEEEEEEEEEEVVVLEETDITTPKSISEL